MQKTSSGSNNNEKNHKSPGAKSRALMRSVERLEELLPALRCRNSIHSILLRGPEPFTEVVRLTLPLWQLRR